MNSASVLVDISSHISAYFWEEALVDISLKPILVQEFQDVLYHNFDHEKS